MLVLIGFRKRTYKQTNHRQTQLILITLLTPLPARVTTKTAGFFDKIDNNMIVNAFSQFFQR